MPPDPDSILAAPSPTLSRKSPPPLRSLRHRAPILWLLLPLILGLTVGKLSPTALPILPLLLPALLCSALAYFLRVRSAVFLLALALSLTCSGAALYELQRHRLAAWETLPPRQAKLTFVVNRLFASSQTGPRWSGLARITSAPTHLADLVGQPIAFSLNPPKSAPLPLVGETLEARAVLEPLPRHAAATDGFASYLANSGLNFRYARGQVLRTVAPASAYRQFCARASARLSFILGLGLEKHADLAAILRGMLLGETHALDPEQRTRFLQSGTLHLFSISGLHIGVIALSLQTLLLVLRVPTRVQFWIIAALLWLYVDITGGAPSAIRAYVMVILLHAAFLLRRPVNPIATLGLAAFIALLLDPMQLFGASFQMSFGIVAALLLYGLPLAELWETRLALWPDLPKSTWGPFRRGTSWLWKKFTSSLAIGLAATLVSTLCGVLYFQLLTPGSLLANLAIIPAASLAIVGGFLSLLSGLLGLDALAAHFNQASALLLHALDHGLANALRLPGMYQALTYTSVALGLALFAALLLWLILGYAARWPRRMGGFWLPWLALAAAMALTTKS